MRTLVRYFIQCLFVIVPAVSWGQADTLYFDAAHLKTTKDSAAYYWAYQITPGHYYKVNEYKINTHQLIMSGMYANLEDKTQDGAFVYYDDSGFVLREGYVAYNNKVGEWRSYYPNTKLLWSVAQYKNGEQEKLTSYYKNGKIKREEVDFKDIASGKCYDSSTDIEIPFTKFEIMPKPTFDMSNYLNMNLKYPSKAKDNNIQGKVITRFVVNEDGSISNVEIIRHANPELDAEAVRVISKMHKWEPGIQDDRPVKVYFTQPITFSLQ